MQKKQQKEALSYFKKHAKKWDRKTKAKSQDTVNIIRQRNEYVLHVIEERKRTEITLDVGCGTGDLVNEIAKRGIRAVGVDFAEEMIKIAKDNVQKIHCKLAKFICCSIFDFNFNHTEYDLISANGFIEYISFKQLNEFLEISFKHLKSGGSLVLGSRNRLFNIFSLNNFTQNEIEEGTVNSLLLESIALVKGLTIQELTNIEPVSLPKVNQKQLNTGIDVSIRYQYTPVQLIRLLKDKGYKPIHISPIHIHGVVPKFKNQYSAIHANISNLLQTYSKKNIVLIPYASSFMIHAKKS